MFDTNLSKIRTKLRTQGAVTGNFGYAKSKAGSPLREIGETKIETVRVTQRSEYIERMLAIYADPPNPSMKEFAYHELHRLNYIKQRRIEGLQRTAEPFKGPMGAS
jgi:hypothetical protein